MTSKEPDSFVLRGPGLGSCQTIANTVFLSKNLSDVEIICGNSKPPIPAHKLLLSCSPVLREQFLIRPELSNIHLENVSRNTACTVLKALYRNAAIVDSKELQECMNMIKTMKMDGFSWEPCESSDSINISQSQQTLSFTAPPIDNQAAETQQPGNTQQQPTTNNKAQHSRKSEPASKGSSEPLLKNLPRSPGQSESRSGDKKLARKTEDFREPLLKKVPRPLMEPMDDNSNPFGRYSSSNSEFQDREPLIKSLLPRPNMFEPSETEPIKPLLGDMPRPSFNSEPFNSGFREPLLEDMPRQFGDFESRDDYMDQRMGPSVFDTEYREPLLSKFQRSRGDFDTSDDFMEERARQSSFDREYREPPLSNFQQSRDDFDPPDEFMEQRARCSTFDREYRERMLQNFPQSRGNFDQPDDFMDRSARQSSYDREFRDSRLSPLPSRSGGNFECSPTDGRQCEMSQDFCSYCANSQCRDILYYAHCMVAHDAVIYPCPCCPGYFEDVREFECHVRENHKSIYLMATEGEEGRGGAAKNRARCSFCSLRIPQSRMMMHVLFKHKRPWIIKQCLLCKNSVDELRTHLVHAHGIS